MKLSIIIPVYNENLTIKKIINDVFTVKLPKGVEKEIIIIDDGSNDGTVEILKTYKVSPNTKIFYHEMNQGKTAAVKTGIKQTTGDYIIIQDADLEYSPQNYSLLLKPVIENKAPVVYGSRFKGQIKNMTLVNRLANILSNITINILFQSNITDFHTCHKLIKKDILKNISINSNNFSFDTEITAKFLKRNIPIFEIPINYTARSKKSGKKITWANALETYFVLFKCKFSKTN